MRAYLQSWRHAFENRKITPGIVIVEGDYVACQTTTEGDFVREFTQLRVGSLPPSGQRVVFDLTNIFRYDNEARIVDEWVKINNHTVL